MTRRLIFAVCLRASVVADHRCREVGTRKVCASRPPPGSHTRTSPVRSALAMDSPSGLTLVE